MDHVTVNVRTAVGSIELSRPVLAGFTLSANDAMSLYPKTVGPELPLNPQDGDAHLIPAEHVATLVARSPGRVVSMICSCGVSVVGDVMPFAGVTRLMLEHLNGGKSDTVLRDVAARYTV